MGGPNSPGGQSTFGQGTSWVPLALAGVGGALAGAGRAGSPASNLGIGLVQPMLSYYANQAATADERARRMKMEDDWIARQQAKDEQAEQQRWADVALKSGQYEVGPSEAPGGRAVTFGKNTMYFNPVQRTGITPYLPTIRALYGDPAAEELIKASANVPDRAIGPFLQTWIPAYQQQHERKQNEAFGGTIDQLSRPQIGMGTGQGGTMSDTPELGAPVIPPALAQTIKASLSIPDARKEALKTIYERLGEYGMDTGAANTTPGVGETSSRRVVQEPGKRPRVETTISPENPQRTLDTKETAFTVAEGERLEKSPGYRALYQAADSAGKEALSSMVNGAKQGIPADLQSLRNAMTSTGTTPESFDKAKLDYYRRTGKLNQFFDRAMENSDPDRQDKRELVKNIGQQIRDGETEITTIPPKHPTYPDKAKRLADKYRMIADASPNAWGKIAFQRMAELLGWDQATYKAEASAFAAQHGLSVKGGQ